MMKLVLLLIVLIVTVRTVDSSVFPEDLEGQSFNDNVNRLQYPWSYIKEKEGKFERKLQSCSKKTKRPCDLLNGICIDQDEVCDGRTVKGNQFCKSAGSCKCCFPEIPSDCSKNTQRPCELLNGTCIEQGEVCVGRTVKGNQFCKSADSCKCCFPEISCGCSKTTQRPCELLNGTCIDQDEICNGRTVMGNQFCNSADSCKCCFPEIPCEDTTPSPTTTTTTTPSPTTPPSVICTIDGKIYDSGEEFADNCMRYYCNGTKWYTDNMYNKACGTCSVDNDPHFTNFGGIKYDWHGQYTYVVSQDGGEDCPDVYIYSKMESCTRGLKWATCVQTIYFQPQPDTTIEVVKADPFNNTMVYIDGYGQKIENIIEDNELQILKGDNGTEHPAFGWIKDECIHIMGSRNESYLVKICDWSLTIFAHPSQKNSLYGLCGAWDKSERLSLRNGSTVPAPNQNAKIKNRNVRNSFGIDWEVPNCSQSSIIAPAYTRAIEVETYPCNATDAEFNNYYENCNASVTASGEGLDDNALEAMIDECAFDQCIAYRAGNKSLAEEWMGKTKGLVKNKVVQKNDTEEVCTGVTLSGQLLTFCHGTLSWEDASTKCASTGGRLASLGDPVAVLDYAKKTYGNVRFWAGATDIVKEGEWVWTNGTPVGQLQWYDDNPNNCCAGQHCLSVNYHGGYDDDGCQHHRRYICEPGADTRCITCDSNSKQYYMHPSDCTKFLQCSQGVTPIEKSCPPGTHWDQSLLTCNHKTNTPCVTAQYINSDGSCKTEGTDTRCITCDSSKSKQYYMHPSDCTKFLQCSQGVPIEKSCPLGTHWDQSLLTCNHKSESPCVTAQYINSDGSCKTDEDWCHSDPGCREKYTTCRKLMCKTLPSNYKRHMKECALEMKIVLPEREPHPGHDHDEHPHPIIECGRPFRPLHPPQDGIMQLLDPSVATKLRKCILIKSRVITSWDGLVNRGVMLDKLYTPFLSYSELVGPIKEAIETTCEEPVDYEIHDFYRCVHKTCIDNIVL